MKVKRGDIWYCNNFGNGLKGILSGPRPVLVISNDMFNACSPVINVVAISGQHKDSPVHFEIDLNIKSYINCEQIYTVNKKLLIEKIQRLDEHQMIDIENLIMFQLGM